MYGRSKRQVGAISWGISGIRVTIAFMKHFLNAKYFVVVVLVNSYNYLMRSSFVNEEEFIRSITDIETQPVNTRTYGPLNHCTLFLYSRRLYYIKLLFPQT